MRTPIKLELTIELIPQSLFRKSLCKTLPRSKWRSIQLTCFRKAGNRCEVCGDVGNTHPVECHEVWDYDDSRFVQKLVGVIALCPDCHSAKHFGLAVHRGKADKAIDHLAKVNGWTSEEISEHVNACVEKWLWRSNHSWTQDLSIVPTLIEP